MDDLAICKAVRRRVVAAAGIDPLISLKVMGETFGNLNQPFWVEEHLVGGSPRPLTNRRTKISSYLLQYDFNVPAGENMEVVERLAAAVEAEFDTDDPERQKVTAAGYDLTVKKIAKSRSQGTRISTLKLVLNIEALNKA